MNPLVLEADGTLVPLQYGAPRAFALGNVRDDSLSALARRWRADGYSRFLEHCRAALREVDVSDGFPFVNWFDVVRDAAASPTGGTT